jgi:hypothetical protein
MRQQHIQQEEFLYLLTTVVRGRVEFLKKEKWVGELLAYVKAKFA